MEQRSPARRFGIVLERPDEGGRLGAAVDALRGGIVFREAERLLVVRNEMLEGLLAWAEPAQVAAPAEGPGPLLHKDWVRRAEEIAHELNQPLTSIVAGAQAGLAFMAGESPDLVEVKAILGDVAAEGRRAAQVIRRLRAFIHGGTGPRVAIDINAVVAEGVDQVRQAHGGHEVVAELELAPGLPTTFADPVRIQQLVVDLVTRAQQARARGGPAGGRIIVSTALAIDEDALEVTVSDAGWGLSADRVDRPVGPFEATRDEDLGVGLALSRTTVEGYGGRMWAERAPGGGVRYCFTLPLPAVPGAADWERG